MCNSANSVHASAGGEQTARGRPYMYNYMFVTAHEFQGLYTTHTPSHAHSCVFSHVSLLAVQYRSGSVLRLEEHLLPAVAPDSCPLAAAGPPRTVPHLHPVDELQ